MIRTRYPLLTKEIYWFQLSHIHDLHIEVCNGMYVRSEDIQWNMRSQFIGGWWPLTFVIKKGTLYLIMTG